MKNSETKPYYYDIEIKQLIAPNGDWEVVFNEGKDWESVKAVVYFAVCDLIPKPLGGYKLYGNEGFRGVIIPIIEDVNKGLSPKLQLYYRERGEEIMIVRRRQEVLLRL